MPPYFAGGNNGRSEDSQTIIFAHCSNRGKRHELIILAIASAVICGAEGWADVELFGEGLVHCCPMAFHHMTRLVVCSQDSRAVSEMLHGLGEGCERADTGPGHSEIEDAETLTEVQGGNSHGQILSL